MGFGWRWSNCCDALYAKRNGKKKYTDVHSKARDSIHKDTWIEFVSYAYFCLFGIWPLFWWFVLNDSLAVMSLSQKNTPEWDNVAFLTSLDLCRILSGLVLVCAVAFLPSCVSFPVLQGGRWFKWRFIAEPSKCAWSPLMVTFLRGQLHLSEALHYISCHCVIFCTFQSPFTFVAVGQALESLFCRISNWGSETSSDFPKVTQAS